MSKESPQSIYPKNVDLNNCDREPIHLIGKIQSHGFLITAQVGSHKICRCSSNCELLFQKKPAQLFELVLSDLLPEPIIEQLLENLDTNNSNYLPFEINQIKVDIIAHLSNEELILEFEVLETRTDALAQQLMLTRLVSTISNTKNANQLNEYMAQVMRKYFGYDRVMILQFDQQWNGSIVAEAKEDQLQSWLGLHYPNTDIPVPARRLFYFENTRMVKDIFDVPVPIVTNPNLDISQEVDLTRSELRAVSPVQIEYLANMKVGATLNVPVLTGKSVWGVILCHHYSAKSISYNERMSYKFLAKFFANQIQINRSDELLKTIKSSSLIRAELISQVIENGTIAEGLTNYKYTLNDLAESEGAAISLGNEVILLGQCPSKTEILAIIQRIKKMTNEIFYSTNHLVQEYPEAQAYQSLASGVMCVFISEERKDAFLWFKPELKETVYWAGKPQNKSTTDEEMRISPRKSFEKWKQIQNGIAAPWKENEISAVIEFRKNIMNFVAHKYEEIKILNSKLKKAYGELESFSYSVSHDLRAPLRGIDGFAQIIKEDYYDALDDFGKSSIETIINSVQKMNMLIDDILAYSGLDQKKIRYQKLSMQKLVEEEVKNFSSLYPDTELLVEPTLADVYGDPVVLPLLIRNLLDNALKYSSKELQPSVSIGMQGQDVFYVRDNGIGFDPKHNEQIFKIFNRLNNDSFKGSGIGLSIAKRVIDKHNGKIWVESEEGQGTTFYFQLNKSNE